MTEHDRPAAFYIQFALDVLEGRLSRSDMDLADPKWKPSRAHIVTACNAMRTAKECLENASPTIPATIDRRV